MEKKSVLSSIIQQIKPEELIRTRERMKLAARIDNILKEKKLSKVKFAQMIGKEPSVISKWLSGTHNFTYDTLIDIAYCLNVNMKEFVEDKPLPLVSSTIFAVGSVQSGLSTIGYAGGGFPLEIQPFWETHEGKGMGDIIFDATDNKQMMSGALTMIPILRKSARAIGLHDLETYVVGEKKI